MLAVKLRRLNSVVRLRLGLQLSLAVAMTCIGFSRLEAEEKVYRRIAFGSCLQQDREKPILKTVVQKQPDAFIFLGDNIYADTSDMREMARKYEQLGNSPEYQQLKKTCPIFAVWDDHDYGVNDAGLEVPFKREAQKVFCNFFEIPGHSRRHREAGNYDALLLGPEGRRVQIVMLDTRSFRTALTKNPEGRKGKLGVYLPTKDPKQSILGDKQWQWLEKELLKPAELRIICSSIQLLSDQHGWESWGTHPIERTRFIQLIQKTKAAGVVVISGDRHRGEISAMVDPEKLDYPLFDITASSLNKPSSWQHVEPNPYRIARKHNGHAGRVVHQVDQPAYSQVHFGMIDILWDEPANYSAQEEMLKFGLYDLNGASIWQWEGKLDQLK